MFIKHENECDCERCNGGTAYEFTGTGTFGGSMCLCPCHDKARQRKEVEQLRIELERVKRQLELAVSGIIVKKTIEWEQTEQDLIAVRQAADAYRRECDSLKNQLATAKRLLNAQEYTLKELGRSSDAVAVIGEPVHPMAREAAELYEENQKLKEEIKALEADNRSLAMRARPRIRDGSRDLGYTPGT